MHSAKAVRLRKQMLFARAPGNRAPTTASSTKRGYARRSTSLGRGPGVLRQILPAHPRFDRQRFKRDRPRRLNAARPPLAALAKRGQPQGDHPPHVVTRG
jgi:hypothetical protein